MSVRNCYKRALFAIGVMLISIGSTPDTIYAQARKTEKDKKENYERQLEASERLKMLRERKAKENQKKIDTVFRLIQKVNKELKLRTSGEKIFDQKRDLENRLRDLITEFKLPDRAMSEAIRLAKEVEAIRRGVQNGPRDSRRLLLVNFLEARRREYIIFATR